MSKTLLLILLFSLLNLHVYADTPGAGAVETVKTAEANQWQNWVFAGSALVAAAGAIFVVSVNHGEKVQSSSHN